MALAHALQLLFDRDLEKVKTEINLYQNENSIWLIDKNIANSAGNLTLHLIGNLNTYIGAGLGNTAYVRNRELEFSAKDVKREELLKAIDEVKKVVLNVLNEITEEQLTANYPYENSYGEISTFHYLLHLNVHLGYHLGQINYHRRLLDL